MAWAEGPPCPNSEAISSKETALVRNGTDFAGNPVQHCDARRRTHVGQVATFETGPRGLQRPRQRLLPGQRGVCDGVQRRRILDGQPLTAVALAPLPGQKIPRKTIGCKPGHAFRPSSIWRATQ